ncbi:uncharacterized protein CLBA1 [Discoglossus pictus]
MKDDYSGNRYVIESRMDHGPMVDDTKRSNEGPNWTLPESSSTWGDFESFNELSPDSEQFYYPEEEFTDTFNSGSSECNSSTTSEGAGCCEHPPHTEWDTLIPAAGDINLFENIFKKSFPEIPVDNSPEDVNSLHGTLAHEESAAGQFMNLHIRSDRALTRCDWASSVSCRNLTLVCGMDPAQKPSEADLIKDTEHPGNEAWNPPGNTTLIQTKLHTFPHSKQGHIFSYQFFLKKSAPEVPFLSFTGKKSFFNTNQFGFNF